MSFKHWRLACGLKKVKLCFVQINEPFVKIIGQTVNPKATVLGEVACLGRYFYPGENTNVFQALRQAGNVGICHIINSGNRLLRGLMKIFSVSLIVKTEAPVMPLFRYLLPWWCLKKLKAWAIKRLSRSAILKSLVNSILYLHNINDPIPAEPTYSLFRKHIMEYTTKTNVNLLEIVFAQITKSPNHYFLDSISRSRHLFL